MPTTSSNPRGMCLLPPAWHFWRRQPGMIQMKVGAVKNIYVMCKLENRSVNLRGNVLGVVKMAQTTKVLLTHVTNGHTRYNHWRFILGVTRQHSKICAGVSFISSESNPAQSSVTAHLNNYSNFRLTSLLQLDIKMPRSGKRLAGPAHLNYQWNSLYSS